MPVSRWRRIAAYPPGTILRKLGDRLGDLAGPRAVAAKLGAGFGRWAAWQHRGAYQERPESGPTNIQHKLDRQAAGGPFEPYEIVLVNKAALQLAGAPAHVAEFGAGTGYFSHHFAVAHPHSRVQASEFEEPTRQWAAANRPAPNLEYGRLEFARFADQSVDLAVAIEVIEHLADYPGFLRQLARVGRSALVTTPNRCRAWRERYALAPRYGDHVREWSAAEFLWVLRCFWDDVKLYGVRDFPGSVAALRRDPAFLPVVEPLDHWSCSPQLVAVCGRPRS